MQHQHTACQLLRSLAVALARQLPLPAASRSAVQHSTSRLPALLPPALQQPARLSTCSQPVLGAWQQVTSRVTALHLPQRCLLQQSSGSWKGAQKPWQPLQQLSGHLLQSRSMATRVEQQAAANPGGESLQGVLCHSKQITHRPAGDHSKPVTVAGTRMAVLDALLTCVGHHCPHHCLGTPPEKSPPASTAVS